MTDDSREVLTLKDAIIAELAARNNRLLGSVESLRRRIAMLEADVLRSDRAVEDAAVALEVCDVELAELSRHVSDLCAAFNSYQVEQHELDCDERDPGVAIFDHGERTLSKR